MSVRHVTVPDVSNGTVQKCGLAARDTSARLGIHGESLMPFVRWSGRPIATSIALFLSLGCVAWTLGLISTGGF